jgi:hypothetical protein
MKSKSEMIKSCAWLGKFVASHELGEYFIVEYKPTAYDGCSPKVPKRYEDESNFHPFINGKDTNTSYVSIEAAIVGAIAYKYDGGNTRADQYFLKAIKPA